VVLEALRKTGCAPSEITDPVLAALVGSMVGKDPASRPTIVGVLDALTRYSQSSTTKIDPHATTVLPNESAEERTVKPSIAPLETKTMCQGAGFLDVPQEGSKLASGLAILRTKLAAHLAGVGVAGGDSALDPLFSELCCWREMLNESTWLTPGHPSSVAP